MWRSTIPKGTMISNNVSITNQEPALIYRQVSVYRWYTIGYDHITNAVFHCQLLRERRMFSLNFRCDTSLWRIAVSDFGGMPFVSVVAPSLAKLWSLIELCYLPFSALSSDRVLLTLWFAQWSTNLGLYVMTDNPLCTSGC